MPPENESLSAWIDEVIAGGVNTAASSNFTEAAFLIGSPF